jgi:hypothetical protein
MLNVSYMGPDMQRLIGDIAGALDERVIWQGEAAHATALLSQATERIATLEQINRTLYAAVTFPYLPPDMAS